jgi:hypothetical protein
MSTSGLTPKEFGDWLTPRRAVEILDAVFKESYLSKNALLERLRGAMGRAVARQAVFVREYKSNTSLPLYELRLDDWGRVDTSDDVWLTGTLVRTYRQHGGIGLETARYYDVRFEPAGIEDIVETVSRSTERPVNAQDEAPNDAASKGPSVPQAQPVDTKIAIGAPRKDWWDDFWIEICGKIYEGDLKPRRQADLERAMHEWASEHGHSVSEATIRKVAKKLFTAWKLRG